MPVGVLRSRADISRVDRPVKDNINVVVPTNNSRAMTSVIARIRQRRMDVRLLAAGADRVALQTADRRNPKKENPACVSAAGFLFAIDF